MIQKARSFIFSTAPIPALAHALKESINIAIAETERRERLLHLSGYLRDQLNEAGIDVPLDNSQIIPVMIGENEQAVELARKMQFEGFDVRAIRPPTVPEGTARLRVSLNANLTEEILRRFVDQLVLVK